MSTPAWAPGTFYVPGALVRPRTEPAAQATTPGNASFTTTGGWTTTDPMIGIVFIGGTGYDGAGRMNWDDGVYGTHTIVNDTEVPVVAGTTINVRCYHRRGTGDTGRQGCSLGLQWRDSSHNIISQSYGAEVHSGPYGTWRLLTGSGTAPPGAAYAQIIVSGFNNNDGENHSMQWDAFTWDYVYSAPPEGLIYRAVQSNAGFSGNQEPSWPTILGQSIPDNEVTWEAVLTSRVVWEATPVLKSGTTEPTWPTVVGGSVPDGTIAWVATSGRIEDEKCPHSPIVALAASKIFAADDDIINYCATVNPLDWSSSDDAGYLPFGLQTYGASPVSAMGLYRGNLVAFNGQGFQMWQVDQDPSAMALLDAVPVPCTDPASVAPWGNDLVFKSPVGVRNITIAGASTNLQADGIGEAIDALIREKQAADPDTEPFGIVVPCYGQYWLVWGEDVYVLTVNGAKKKSWTRYTYNEPITDATLMDGELYLRMQSGKVLRVSDEFTADDYYGGGISQVNFSGVLWWPYLDMGNPGRDKQLHSFDLAVDSPTGLSVSIGYDQRNRALRTEDYYLYTPETADTLPGTPIPMPVTAPTLDFKVTFMPDQAWEWYSANFYLQDMSR